jgi:ABC-type branched-subunit amino acid transport system substrate-binding protein
MQAAKDQVRSKAGVAPVMENYAAAEFSAATLVGKVEEIGAKAIIFAGVQAELDALLAELIRVGKAPRIYLLSSLVSRPLLNAPGAFDKRIQIAYPTLSRDITQRGREGYGELAERYELPREHIQAQLASFAAAQLFVEGLRRAGRDLSRERLVEGIEKLYRFETGVTPPLTFGPNRRIGARGAHIVTVNIGEQTYEPVGKSWFDVR